MKNRYVEVDILKIFACICVIFIHISASLVDSRNVGIIFINCFTRFAVPCFIFASGLILAVIYKNRDTTYSEFQKKRLNSVLLPYLTWTIIYLIINTGVGAFPLNAQSIWNGIVWGNSSYHLYFMVIIIQLYIIFPVVKTVFKKMNPAVSCLLILAYQMTYTSLSPVLIANFKFFEQHYDRLFTTYLTFFLIGTLTGLHYESIKNTFKNYKLQISGSLLFLCAMSLFAWTVSQLPESGFPASKFDTPYTWTVYSILASLTALSVSIVIAEKISHEKYKKIEMIGAATFYVYLAHPLLLSGLDALILRSGIKNVFLILTGEAAILTAVCFALSVMYLKFKKNRKALRNTNLN